MNICPWRHTPHIHTKQFRCSDGKAVSGTICCVTDTICGGLVVNILSGVIRSYVHLSSIFFCFSFCTKLFSIVYNNGCITSTYNRSH